jgi:hypothetical protein
MQGKRAPAEEALIEGLVLGGQVLLDVLKAKDVQDRKVSELSYLSVKPL